MMVISALSTRSASACFRPSIRPLGSKPVLGSAPASNWVEDGVRDMRLFASRYGRAPLFRSCPDADYASLEGGENRIMLQIGILGIQGAVDVIHLWTSGNRGSSRRDALKVALGNRYPSADGLTISQRSRA